jgi:hypothetical protein
MSRYNPKPPVDLKNPELRAYLVESYVDFGRLAHEIIGKLIQDGVREPVIHEAVCNAVVNQPVVYRVQEFYAQPSKPTPQTETAVNTVLTKMGLKPE